MQGPIPIIVVTARRGTQVFRGARNENQSCASIAFQQSESYIVKLWAVDCSGKAVRDKTSVNEHEEGTGILHRMFGTSND